MKPLRKYVTRKEISSARCVELSRFIEQNHHSLVQRTGCSLFLKSNTSVYIKDGHTGYSDFSTGDHGNSIDFLMRYIGYGFVDAVYALNDFAGAKDNHAEKRCDKDEAPAESLSVCRSICLPPPAPRPYRRMYAYLQARGIPLRIISFLENNHLAYQENKHGNI